MNKEDVKKILDPWLDPRTRDIIAQQICDLETLDREKIAEFLYYMKYASSSWLIASPELKEYYRKKADQILALTSEPKPDEPMEAELDRTKLHEWGSPKGLPEGWRGKILKATSGQPKPDELRIEADLYTLSCNKCGKAFSSNEAFPNSQVCPECSDESRLLTAEKLLQIRNEVRQNTTEDSYASLGDWTQAVLKAQRDLTASIKDAQMQRLALNYDELLKLEKDECQRRVERIFRGIEKIAKSCPEEPIGRLLDSMVYQSLKKQEGIE